MNMQRMTSTGAAWVAAFLVAPAAMAAQDRTILPLNGAWELRAAGSTELIPATVPGCVHTDLIGAGRIPDPFFRTNETDLQWIGETNWVYRRTFVVPESLAARQHLKLRCDGLDTLATVTLNGRELGRTDNMFRTWEFDVKPILRAGTNTIEIAFDSVLPWLRAKEKERPLPTWTHPGIGYLRKQHCHYGWDWGPTLITCGIWKDIAIEAYDTARIADVQILQDHSRAGAVTLTVKVAAEPAGDGALGAKVSVARCGDNAAPAVAAAVKLNQGRGEATIPIANPELWWPAGMGAQPLYRVAVELTDAGSRTLDTAARRIGLRKMRALSKTDSAPMQFVVNDVPFFAKGGNWIPADSFPTRVPPATLRRYVEDAVAVNMNSMRFWGGGYYEDDALFDACDELGIVVWLDCKFSCTTYPSFDEAFLANVREEVRDNVRRLRDHPSIGVWCGNNEVMFFRGGDTWTTNKMSSADYYRLFRDAIGDQVRELAPQADYVTGSPDCGDVHFWDVWHGGKPFEVYRDIHGFVSEFGFQSFPERLTVESFTAPEDRASVESPVMKYHMRSNRMYLQAKEDGSIGTAKIMNIVRRYFREPRDFDSALRVSQITQGYGIQYGAEGWRREMPKSMGCVYWQYNDCWPGSSWSSVDYFGRWKALHYLARRFYAPVMVSAVPTERNNGAAIHLTSDRMKDCEGTLAWQVTSLDGSPLVEGSCPVTIPAHRSAQVRTLDLESQMASLGPTNLLLWTSVTVAGERVSDHLCLFAYPRFLDLQDPGLTAEAKADGDGFAVTVRAARPALWTWVELTATPARYSDNYVNLRRGDSVVIRVKPEKPLTLDAFRAQLKVRSLQDTYASPGAAQ